MLSVSAFSRRLPKVGARAFCAAGEGGQSQKPMPTFVKGSACSSSDAQIPPPKDHILAAKAPKQIVSVIGAPMVFGQKMAGTDRAPDFLRKSGNLMSRIKSCDWLIEDLGNLELPERSMLGPKAHFVDVIGTCNEIIADAWCRVAEDRTKFVLSIGGDHSIAIGTVAAALKSNPECVIIWVDAHADINTPATSGSGSFHGMPIGINMRLEGTPTHIDEFKWLLDYPPLKPEQLVYLGLRDVDPPEKMLIKEHGIKTYTMHDIDRLGMGKVMDEVMDYVGKRPMHLSFDIDACDPVYAGSTGTCVRGGLTFRETQYICEVLASSNQLGSMDMVEVNPKLEEDGVDATVESAIAVIESCLGKSLI